MQGDYYRKPQLINMWSCGAQAQGIHLGKTPTLRLMEYCGRGGEKIVRVRGPGSLL